MFLYSGKHSKSGAQHTPKPNNLNVLMQTTWTHDSLLMIFFDIVSLCRCWFLWSDTLETNYTIRDWFKTEKQNYHENGGHAKDGLLQGDSEWYECGESEMMGMVAIWTWTPLYSVSYIHSKTKIYMWFFAWIGNHDFILLFRIIQMT